MLLVLATRYSPLQGTAPPCRHHTDCVIQHQPEFALRVHKSKPGARFSARSFIFPWLLSFAAVSGSAVYAGESVDSDGSVEHSSVPSVWIDGDTIHYEGAIEASAVVQVRSLLEASTKVRELAIESPGGDIGPGLDLGWLIHTHGLDVRVTGSMCWSSCANYVFPAGRKKTIEPGAVVVWHGSAIQEGFGKQVDVSQMEEVLGRPLTKFERWIISRKARRLVRSYRRQQAAFYRELDVDERITVFGQQVGCGCEWTLSVDDMAVFGVTGVEAKPEYGLAPQAEGDMRWRLLRLSDYPTYAESLGDQES